MPDVFISPWPRRLVALCGKRLGTEKGLTSPSLRSIEQSASVSPLGDGKPEGEIRRLERSRWRERKERAGSTMNQRQENQESGDN